MESTSNEARMKQVAFLMAYQALKTYLSDATQKEKIVFLSKAGFSTQEIAELVGAKSATVSVRISESKKKKTSVRKPKK